MKNDAVILAGGFSSRANGFKPLFEIGGTTLIERAVVPFLKLCDKVIVVTGYRSKEINEVLKKYQKVHLVFNKDYEDGMFSSIKKGVSEVNGDRFFLTPGDYPFITEEICEFLTEFNEEVIIPSFSHRKGHPILIDSKLKDEILHSSEVSLREFLNKKNTKIVSVKDEGVLKDIDTGEDYIEAVEVATRRDILNKKKDISISVPRHDAKDKISGKTEYLNDIQLDNFLWAKTLRSTKSRAKIKNIKYPIVPDGYYIIDYKDIPGRNRVKTIEDDQPIFAQEIVNYIGEPIALIAGQDKEIILDIISKIKIEYEELNAICTIEDALYKDKSILKPLFKDDNLFANYKINRGDVDAVFKKAFMLYEGEYSTGYQEHLYLETQSVMGVYDNDEIIVYGSMQCPYYVKAALIQALDMSEEKVNVVQTTTGGAFGGKEEYPSQLAAQVAVAALKCKSNVKLIFERDEDIEFTTKRHPSKISIKGAVDKSHKLIALDIDIKLDGGAYAGLSKVILQRAMFAGTAAYYVPELRILGKAIATNTLIGGAFRGFGAPQSIFAIESFMEQFSAKLGIDSNEFRKINFLKIGDKSCTDGTFREFIPLEDMYNRIRELTFRKEVDPEKLIGTGYSFFYHGCGFTGSGEKDHIKAEVLLVKDDDEVEVLISNVEMGQGASVTLRKIVAHTLEIPLKKVKFVNPDTRRVPDSGPTVASRTIMIVGKLLYDAAIELKNKWVEEKFLEIRKNYVHPFEFEWNEEELKGDAYNSYSWGANAVELEVDPITFEVKVRKVWTIFDIGKAIDERIVMGQIDGGIVQGLGYASIEVMRQLKGRIQQRTNTDYIIPTSMDFPNIHKELINNPYELGPYGAKGLGEITFVGIPVAYSNAVSNALNIGVYELPVTPETLLKEGE